MYVKKLSAFYNSLLLKKLKWRFLFSVYNILIIKESAIFKQVVKMQLQFTINANFMPMFK